MPLGDSITYGFNGTNYPYGDVPGGYRRQLGVRLAGAGVIYDFVGSRRDNPAFGIDPDHNGYPGWRTDQILANIPSWLSTNPEVVLLHVGTNDMIQHVPVGTAANNLNALIQQITAGAPTRRVYVSTIIPIVDTRDGHTPMEWAGIIAAYNTQVRNIVASYAGQERKVYLVDMNATLKYTDSNPSNNFFQPADGTHPGSAGYNQMGDVWFNAIVASAPPPPTPVGPQMLVNGGLESGLIGWNHSGNLAVQTGGGYVPVEGIKLVAFNSGNSQPNGVLSQTFATTPGAKYSLTFAAGVYSYNTSSQFLKVSVMGTSSLISQVVSVTGAGNGTTRWTRQGFGFVANSSSTTLSFSDQSTSTNALDLLLDDVRVTATEKPIANTAPVAMADSYVTGIGAQLQVPAPGVLVNDSDAQSDTLTAVRDSGPGSGSLILNANGSFSYTPSAGFTGTDTFTYHANDGSQNSSVVTVSINVSSQGTVTLANGGFESNFAGWTATGNVLFTAGAPYLPSEGNVLAAFNGGNKPANGTLSRTLATTAGRTYTLTFDVGILSYNNSPQTLHVSAIGGSTLLSKSITINGSGGGSTRWQTQSTVFVADSANTLLTFSDRSLVTDAIDLLLDNVRIASASASPPPSNIPISPTLRARAMAPDVFGHVALSKTAGGIVITAQTSHACTYFLQSSSDLVEWEFVQEKTTHESANVEFLHSPALKDRRGSLFYRIGHRPHPADD